MCQSVKRKYTITRKRFVRVVGRKGIQSTFGGRVSAGGWGPPRVGGWVAGWLGGWVGRCNEKREREIILWKTVSLLLKFKTFLNTENFYYF